MAIWATRLDDERAADRPGVCAKRPPCDCVQRAATERGITWPQTLRGCARPAGHSADCCDLSLERLAAIDHLADALNADAARREASHGC